MSELKFTIRSMKREDWAQFCQIEVEIFPEDAMSEEFFYKRVEKEGFFALETNVNQIIGYLVLGLFGEDAAHLGRIGVIQSMQNKKLGTKLMEFALRWFQEKKDVTKVILYTQEDNFKAQKLYKKFGFKVTATTWHFFVPQSKIDPSGKYSCQPISSDEIESVGQKYDVRLPAAQIRRFLTSNQLVLTLKDRESKIVGACRFDPNYPGCFPFIIEDVKMFDDFIDGLGLYASPKFDYVRITFTDNHELAQLLENKGFRLHHKLFKMVLDLSKI